jgi:hypothetical protein
MRIMKRSIEVEVQQTLCNNEATSLKTDPREL